ncbi:hypothetical protein EXIGLDRAFT_719891 [Exidia glandulosa HHB12029]|uniref:Uncharacterized protein n=1 Tax=Exidia glandulosa HHB12029 TaxID=1314781 RepID=A0A165GQJ5_EXIGL|nr:hypothetical protein EXIGLDRAFT_719891 [Exidia glandulosa HHB12029]
MHYLARSHSTSSLHALFSRRSTDPNTRTPIPPNLDPQPATIQSSPISIFATLRRKPVPAITHSKSAPQLGSAHDQEPRMPGAFDLPASEPQETPSEQLPESSEPAVNGDRAVLRERVLNLSNAPRTSPTKSAVITENADKENVTRAAGVSTRPIKPFVVSNGARGVRKPIPVAAHKQAVKRRKATTSLRQQQPQQLAPCEELADDEGSDLDSRGRSRVRTVSFSRPGPAVPLQVTISADIDRVNRIARVARYPRLPSLLSPRRDIANDALLASADPDDDGAADVIRRMRKKCQTLPGGALRRAIAHRNVACLDQVPLRIRLRSRSAVQGLAIVFVEDNAPMLDPIGAHPTGDALNPAIFPRAGDLCGNKERINYYSKIDRRYASQGYQLHKVSRIACLEDFSGRADTASIMPTVTIVGIDEREADRDVLSWIAEVRDAMRECQMLHVDYVSEVDRASNYLLQWELRWRLLEEGERRRTRVQNAIDGLKRARHAAMLAAQEASMEVHVDHSEVRDEDSMDVDVDVDDDLSTFDTVVM